MQKPQLLFASISEGKFFSFVELSMRKRMMYYDDGILCNYVG